MAQTHAKVKVSSRSSGNARTSSEYTNGRLPLPPVQTSKADHIAEGMIVSSMAVPPQKAFATSARRLSNVSENKLKSGASPETLNGRTADEWERLLREKDKAIKDKDREIREKNAAMKSKAQEMAKATTDIQALEARVVAIDKECASLKIDISKREKDAQQLQSIIDAKKNEKDYKALYEAEVAAHQRTTDLLTLVNEKLDEKVKQLLDAEKRHAEQVLALQAQMEEKMKVALQEKDDQIKEKNEVIQKMKKQMAEAFAGSSVERQQQIDELSKELSKVQTECENLRMKIRQGGHKGQSLPCENCKNLKAHLEKKEQTIKERNRTVDELTLICDRYEVQLKQQEELLKQWQDAKGRMLIFDK
ncbi:uncharacterized protein [Watersipora subatra]|uniref:uncharacterized protein n=1 Tax=Watersipora subatra TaxID=2589382 RepID=UPI00355C36EA